MAKKFISLLICSSFFICSYHAHAQEITDTRKKNEGFKKLQPANVRADVATFALGGIAESVGKNPLQKINYTAITDSTMIFEGEGIKAVVKLEAFIPENHKLTYDEKTLTKIDKRAYYGNYGQLPKTTITSVLMIIDGDTVLVPPTAYQDIHDLHFVYSDKGTPRTRNGVFRSADGKNYYLYLFSKDDKNTYEVTWIFAEGKYFRRVLDYDLL